MLINRKSLGAVAVDVKEDLNPLLPCPDSLRCVLRDSIDPQDPNGSRQVKPHEACQRLHQPYPNSQNIPTS